MLVQFYISIKISEGTSSMLGNVAVGRRDSYDRRHLANARNKVRLAKKQKSAEEMAACTQHGAGGRDGAEEPNNPT